MPGTSVINTTCCALINELWRFLMRGNAARQVEMLTAVTPDALIPQGHPIGRNKPMVDTGPGPAFAHLCPEVCPKRSRLDTAGAPAESRPADGASLGAQ